MVRVSSEEEEVVSKLAQIKTAKVGWDGEEHDVEVIRTTDLGYPNSLMGVVHWHYECSCGFMGGSQGMSFFSAWDDAVAHLREFGAN